MRTFSSLTVLLTLTNTAVSDRLNCSVHEKYGQRIYKEPCQGSCGWKFVWNPKRYTGFDEPRTFCSKEIKEFGCETWYDVVRCNFCMNSTTNF